MFEEKVMIPKKKGFWGKLMAFVGPAYLVSVGYMDPGNWATDLAGGAQFGYTLIWVILISNIMAILFQSLSARLGIVTGKDLAQISSAHYDKPIAFMLWILSEIAIISTDIAEALGSAIGIALIFNIPILYGVIITAFDTLILMLLSHFGVRKIEAFIVLLILIIGGSFLVELIISKPDYVDVLAGFIPSIPNSSALYIAIGIIGATIMPHNLYLHSSLVQTRKLDNSEASIMQGIKFNFIDSAIALNLAFFVNAAILVVSAAVFHTSGNTDVADIMQAHQLLEPLLGTRLAPTLFGIALIAAGQSSTITGTYAGQIVMEGFIHIRLNPWVRRLITRLLAIIPAVIIIIISGDSGVTGLLILSQVVLSLQLSFAVIPLIHFVSSKPLMKQFVIGLKMQIVAWTMAIIILALNIKLVIDEVSIWFAKSNALVDSILVVAILWFIFLLLFIIIEPILKRPKLQAINTVHTGVSDLNLITVKPYEKICLSLDFSTHDQLILSHAVHIANPNSTLVLIHIVESPTAVLYGNQTDDTESKNDLNRLKQYQAYLNKLGMQNVIYELGFGRAYQVLPGIIKSHNPDLVILGSHGHKGLKQLLFGSVNNQLRKRINIPILIAQA